MVKKAKKVVAKKNKTEEIAELLFERTQKWAKTQGLLKEGKSKYTTKGKKYDKLITNIDICNAKQEQAIRDLVSNLIDEKIPPVKNKSFKIEFKHGVVIVPLTGTNNSFELGEPILIKDALGGAIKMDGEQPKASIKATNVKDIRPATLEEIEELMKELLKIDNFDSLLLGMILNKMGES